MWNTNASFYADPSNADQEHLDEEGHRLLADAILRWIRISGELKEDNRIEVHHAILEEYPHLKNAYMAGDDNTNTLY